jgi:hypothetical protein
MMTQSTIHRVLLVLFIIAAMSLQASEPTGETRPSANYCEDNQGFDQWDFWVGEWNVYSNDGKRQLAGSNSVTKHYNNCLILENWTSAGGGGGMSMNYFNPLTGTWRQLWVSDGYSIDYSGGLNEQGEMVLSGELFDYNAGARQNFRGIWTALDNGEVIQHFDIQAEKDGAWQTWFEGRYIRKDADAEVGAEVKAKVHHD